MSKKILVVDDSAIMRKMIIRELLQMNLTTEDLIEQAEDGVQAVKKIMSTQYDLVLMDWNMPNKLGIEALEEVRAAGNKTPIMMITTEAESANVVKAVQAGANNYLVKPFNSESLQTKINQVIPA
jgi:two-component system, chemotaxis family, chemotaxis protein CheY